MASGYRHQPEAQFPKLTQTTWQERDGSCSSYLFAYLSLDCHRSDRLRVRSFISRLREEEREFIYLVYPEQRKFPYHASAARFQNKGCDTSSSASPGRFITERGRRSPGITRENATDRIHRPLNS